MTAEPQIDIGPIHLRDALKLAPLIAAYGQALKRGAPRRPDQYYAEQLLQDRTGLSSIDVIFTSCHAEPASSAEVASGPGSREMLSLVSSAFATLGAAREQDKISTSA